MPGFLITTAPFSNELNSFLVEKIGNPISNSFERCGQNAVNNRDTSVCGAHIGNIDKKTYEIHSELSIVINNCHTFLSAPYRKVWQL
jgi:hypothetical protein